jgi:hypothetical protein
VRESAGSQREVFDISDPDAPEPRADQLAVVIDIRQGTESCGVEASAQLLCYLRGHCAHGWRLLVGVRTQWTVAMIRSAVRGWR